MKKLLLVVVFAASIISCHKGVSDPADTRLTPLVLQKALRDSLSLDDYNQLDFTKFVVSKFSNTSVYRVGFKAKEFSKYFLLLNTTRNGCISRGLLINLNRDEFSEKTRFYFNGSISISSLNKKDVITSKIVNGYISSLHTPSPVTRMMVVPSESNVLPDVVVTAYVNSSQNSYPGNTWISYFNFFNSNSGMSGAYNPLSGDQAGYTSGIGGSGNSNMSGTAVYPNSSSPLYEPIEQKPIKVDFEFVEDLSAIKIADYLKCFSNLPDAGAKCSIEILTDVPVDSDPDKLFNWNTGSPGHTFLQIKKENGDQQIMQNIGFYPVHGLKTLLTTGPVEGKFVDNGEHEYNASLKMEITAAQLKNTISHILDLSRTIEYDIDDYNCTDFALDVFNYSRPNNPLVIPKYYVPFSVTTLESNTPQGVYNKLKSMKQSGIESGHITIPGVKQFVDDGSGPCQ